MSIIYREKYLNRINQFMGTPIIKILTGMRRVGKSTILSIIKNDLLKNVDDRNKIYMNFESLKLRNIVNDQDLIEYLIPIIDKLKGKIYFFFDEIQLVQNWEKIVNGLRTDYNCEIFITGSNSKLLSGDLSSLLAGRFVEFEIQPFTFTEFIQIFKSLNLSMDELFDKFIELGGMPELKYFDLDEETSSTYLSDVYNTVLVKDVLRYQSIRDVDLFNRILHFAMENIGHTFSALSIRKFLKNEGREVSVDTILNYLSYCQNAFIINKVPRYDTVGKKILKIDEKYYLTDLGFRHAIGFSNHQDIERSLENIVYQELRSRNYEITIGKVKELEIDFITKKKDQIKYFQVAYLLETEKTRQREFNVYQEECPYDNNEVRYYSN